MDLEMPGRVIKLLLYLLFPGTPSSYGLRTPSPRNPLSKRHLSDIGWPAEHWFLQASHSHQPQ